MQSVNTPMITNVVKKTGVITGKADANCTIYIKFGNATFTSKSNRSGNFKITTKKFSKSTAIKVRAKNSAGVYSKWAEILIE